MNVRATLAALAVTLALANAAFAQQPGQKVDATLSSGDVIRGVLIADDGKTVVISHPVLGDLRLDKANVKSMVAVPDAAPPPPPPPPPTAAAAKPDPDSFWKGWDFSLELGVNGSEGNSEALSVRAAATATREDSKTLTIANVSYVYSTTDGDKSVDHGEINIRNDWKTGTPWRIFIIGKQEYDTFQSWVWRTTLVGGVGYEFIKTDDTLLMGRFGAGATKEFGSDKQRIDPELDIGMDFEHKFDERSKIFATVDYYPSLHRFTDYLASAKAGYEITVDPVNKLALKLGVDDRYDSSPGEGKKKNDLLYFATIVYNF